MNHKKIAFLSLPIIALLSGCGGGGGGGGSSLTQITFTDIDSVTVPSVVNINSGIARDFSYTASSTAVTSVFTNPTDIDPSGVALTYNSDTTLNKVAITTDNSSVTINESSGGNIGNLGNDIVYGYDSAGEDFILAANPVSSNIDWNYQTFGIWETGRGTGSGTAGGISVGALTDPSNIPTSGSATFSGYYGGVLVDTTGNDFITKGSLTATIADWSARSIAFQTSNDQYVSPVSSTPSWKSDPSQAMSGTLSYSSSYNADNIVFGGVITDGYGWSGTLAGKFYGPNAEEMGGVFSIYGNGGVGIETHAGAFGAAQ